MTDQVVDLLIVGGGIHGAGIARDAAGRGLSVMLCEQGDLADHASSAVGDPLHGGLSDLERGEFWRVRAALIEREVLRRMAPHLVRPLRCILPRRRRQRPTWLTQLGLMLYDHLSRREQLPVSAAVKLRSNPFGAPLKPELTRALTYSDCWIDDARMVVLNAIAAAERGAAILTRTRCIAAQRIEGLWRAELAASQGQPLCQVYARALINAAGPWAAEFLRQRIGLEPPGGLRLIKGCHIVVPRLFAHHGAYTLRQGDGRMVHALPYGAHFSLIGTIQVDYRGEPAQAKVSDREVADLCAAVADYFAKPVRPQDVVWSSASVWPVRDEPAQHGADPTLALDVPAGGAPLLSVFGGSLVTYRKRAEQAVAKLQPRLRFTAGPWTATAPLPGGDLNQADFDAFLGYVRGRWPWLGEDLAGRYARAYGTRLERLLGTARRLDDLGQPLGDGLYEAEIDYLVRHEWAQTETDILWRRTKLGLRVGVDTATRLRAWLHGDNGAATRPAAVAS